MAAPTIVTFEAALLVEMANVSGLNVASYQGQDDEAGAGDAVTFPVAWPFYAGEKFGLIDGPNYHREQVWKIRCGAQNYGGAVTPHTAAATLAEAIVARMVNWKNSAGLLGIERFVPVSVVPSRVTRTAKYFDITFTVAFDQNFTAQAW